MLVLVSYDIGTTSPEGQRRLRRVAKQCVNYGVRVQNSVFECHVDQTQYTLLKHALAGEIDPEHDSLRFYNLGNRFSGKTEHFGVKRGLDVTDTLIL